jgi:hypothetical protein
MYFKYLIIVKMGDTWIDATQSYENETNTASTEITIVDNVDLLNPPPSSDAY